MKQEMFYSLDKWCLNVDVMALNQSLNLDKSPQITLKLLVSTDVKQGGNTPHNLRDI